MNERIKKLAESAGADEFRLPHGYAYGLIGEEAILRFAKLIAEECAGIAYRASEDGDVPAMDILYEFDVDGARSQK